MPNIRHEHGNNPALIWHICCSMQTRQPELFVALSITWSFATLTLVLRLLCRRITKNRLWLDDYFAIIAYVRNIRRCWLEASPSRGRDCC